MDFQQACAIIFSKLIHNRDTFMMQGENCACVTNIGKALSRKQAYRIADNLCKRITKLNLGVLSYIEESSDCSQPIKIIWIPTKSH